MPTLIAFLSFVFTIIPSTGYFTVTTDPNAVTFYSLAYEIYGADVLLAHSDKAGASYYQLSEGDIIALIYPGRSDRMQVTDILRYRATDPANLYSYFVDLDSGQSYGSEELGRLIYDSGHRLILQTCIEQDGDPNWGRLFVIAEKMQDAKAVKAGR